jgi:hypothetical protein
LKKPDLEYPGNLGRTAAERVSPTKAPHEMVYNLRVDDKLVVITVERSADTQELTRARFFAIG